MSASDSRSLAVPTPDVIRVSADDVLSPEETAEQAKRDIRDATKEIGERLRQSMSRFEEALFYGNLRTPEDDASSRYSSPVDEASWLSGAIDESIEYVEDPSLRRALREEFHR